MNNRTSGGLVKLSLAAEEEQVEQIDAVAEELTPPASRNSAARYLIDLGIAAHNKKKAEDREARELLASTREQAS